MMLTTWLLVFAGLTVTAIVIDGLRRMFVSHAALKIDIDESLCGLPQEKYTSELPNGGARSVGDESITTVINNDHNVEVELYVDLEPMALVIEDLAVEDLIVESVPDKQFEEADLVLEVAAVNHLVEELDDTDAALVKHDELDHDADRMLDTLDVVSNEEVFILDSTPVSLSAEEIKALTTTFNAGGIFSDVAAEHAMLALDFDPTRPVHELVETNSMVQSDLFAEQDFTASVTVKNYVAHELLETSDDILFSDTGIEDLGEEDLAASGAEYSAQHSQDESLSTKIAKVTSMTFGKKLLSRKRLAAQKAIEHATVEERSRNNIPVVEQVISILVTANDSQGFYGPQLLKLVEACGLVHGEMDIFHRFEDGLRLGKTQFSMANMMEPGTFNLTEIDHLHTPGVVFFLTLPTAQDNMQAFDYMLETAQCLAANLSGEVLDEKRSVMRPQTIEHCRQQIREFERRNMTRRAQL